MKKKEISFSLIGSFLAGICLSASAAAPIDVDGNRKMLWPSDETVLRAQKDSSVRLLSDGSMAVKTGVEYDWPGVRLGFKSGEYDLSKYATILISVSNMTDKTIGVSLSVKGKTVQGSTPGGHIRLRPRESGMIVSDLRERNGNPLQCSCLENPRDGGAWWTAVYGVAQSRTRLKRLSSRSKQLR